MRWRALLIFPLPPRWGACSGVHGPAAAAGGRPDLFAHGHGMLRLLARPHPPQPRPLVSAVFAVAGQRPRRLGFSVGWMAGGMARRGRGGGGSVAGRPRCMRRRRLRAMAAPLGAPGCSLLFDGNGPAGVVCKANCVAVYGLCRLLFGFRLLAVLVDFCR